jgi:hypothetical protein
MFGIIERFRYYIGDIERAFRSLPVVEDMKNSGLLDSKILEVGGGNLGISPFINRDLVIADITFPKKKDRRVVHKKLNGVNLPFEDDSFDVVVSIDMLEHVDKDLRNISIHEMLRVARNKLYLVVPEGEISELQDEKLDIIYRRVHGKSYPYLQEHVKFKLPRKQTLLNNIKIQAADLGKKIVVNSYNNLNINLRFFILRSWITKGLVGRIIFKSFIILLPLRKLLNFGVCYRKVFVVDIS